jgi:hypothetical protein
MLSDKNWVDSLDIERIETHREFRVFRNYIDSKGSFGYSRHSAVPNSIQPIAIGITAFLICDHHSLKCLKSILKQNLKFTLEDYFIRYLTHCIQTAREESNNITPRASLQEVEKKFIPIHLLQEKQRFVDSEKYFKEENEKDMEINVTIKKNIIRYFEWLNSQHKTDVTDETIINEFVLRAIFNKYSSNFPKETTETWITRFCCNSSINFTPVELAGEAREGTNKLILLAILSFVQTKTGNAFDFDDFVEKRFGIKNYQKAKSEHKSKDSFNDVFKKCDKIEKEMT